MIDTRFWIDDYVSHLDPVEKLLFLYFLTNPFTEICGIYEVPVKNIALDTGIEEEMVKKILKRFEFDNKIFYENGWVAIKNFAKHQLDNPKVSRGIERGMEKAPEALKNKVISKNNDRLPIVYDRLSHLNSNSNADAIPVAEATAFESQKYLKEMLNNKKRHLRIIGLYLLRRNADFKSAKEVSEAIKRHSRASIKVAVFTNERILEAISVCEKMKDIAWTLDTVLKVLTK